MRAFDRLHRLSRGRQVRSFQNVSDSDLVQRIASEVGLQAQVGPTPEVHDYLLQDNQTNLEFLHAAGGLALGYPPVRAARRSISSRSRRAARPPSSNGASR